MKVLAIAVCGLILSGWSASHATDEFGKRTGKTGVVGTGLVDIRNDYQHHATMMMTQNIVGFAIIARHGKYMDEFLMGEIGVSIRVPSGTYRFKGYGSCKNTTSCNIILFKRNEYRRVVSLLRKNRSIKVAIIGEKNNYVFTVNAMGFTRVYNRARW